MNKFEQLILDTRDKPENTILELFGWKLAPNSAEKHLKIIRKYIRWKNENFPSKKDGVDLSGLDEVEIKHDGTRTTKRMLFLSETDKNNPDRIMRLMGLDPLQWELVGLKMRRKYWDVTMKLREDAGETSKGNQKYKHVPHKETNHSYMVEVTTKPKQFLFSEDSLKNLASSFTPPPMVIYHHERKKKNPLLMVSNIVDFHFGDASRYESVDHARKHFERTVQDQLKQVDEYGLKIGKILFVVGNDFFHFDNAQKKTVNGTQMIETHQTEEMYETGIKTIAWALENYRAVAPVDVMLIRGNHDWLLSYTLGWFLWGIYKDCDDVAFDLEKTYRKYYHWGNCSLGFGHADKEKSRLLYLMQAECPFWSETIYREFHSAHLHSEEVKEIPGVKFRRLPTIAPRTIGDWEDNSGFMSMRENQTFIWDRERGKKMVLITN